jgi:hypothetical protein
VAAEFEGDEPAASELSAELSAELVGDVVMSELVSVELDASGIAEVCRVSIRV